MVRSKCYALQEKAQLSLLNERQRHRQLLVTMGRVLCMEERLWSQSCKQENVKISSAVGDKPLLSGPSLLLARKTTQSGQGPALSAHSGPILCLYEGRPLPARPAGNSEFLFLSGRAAA